MDANTAPAPYQPANDADAREAARQILGDSIDHVLTGDWHQALVNTAALWGPDNTTPETTWRSRTTFQVHAVLRAVRKTAQAIHHLSTNPIVATAGIALTLFLWLASPTVIAAAFTPIGVFVGLAWAIDGNEKTCPICRHNHRTETA